MERNQNEKREISQMKKTVKKNSGLSRRPKKFEVARADLASNARHTCQEGTSHPLTPALSL